MDLGRYHKRIDAVCDHYFRDITNWGSEKPYARVLRYVTDEISEGFSSITVWKIDTDVLVFLISFTSNIPNDTLIQPSMHRCSHRITRFHTMMHAKILSSWVLEPAVPSLSFILLQDVIQLPWTLVKLSRNIIFIHWFGQRTGAGVQSSSWWPWVLRCEECSADVSQSYLTAERSFKFYTYILYINFLHQFHVLLSQYQCIQYRCLH